VIDHFDRDDNDDDDDEEEESKGAAKARAKQLIGEDSRRPSPDHGSF